jgi:hypothetical protein
MHPLDGPRLKLRRAEKHLNDVKTTIDTFINNKPYTFVVEANPEPPNYVIIARMKQPAPDDELSVTIGDFAHNARSALDLLVYQLSELPPDDRGRFSLQFPIFDTPEGYRDNVKRYLAMVAPEHTAIIEEFQPYKRVDGFDKDALGMLRDINDTDKHRIIHTVGCVARLRRLDFYGPGQLGNKVLIPYVEFMSIPHGGEGRVDFGNGFSYESVGLGLITKDRTVIAKITAAPPLQVNMDPKAQIVIKFDEGSARVKGRPVVDTLTFIYDRVEEVIGKFEHVFLK